MSEGPAATTKPKGVLKWALWGAALLGVAAVLYIIGQASTKPQVHTEATAPAAPAAKTLMSKWSTEAAGAPPPDYAFYDEAGKPVKVADLKGKVVVMNVWATWCAPCKVEMPTLAKLQAAYAGQPVEVVAVSIDSESSAAEARLFIASHDPLKFYHDREMKLPFRMDPPAAGAPTTVVYGKDGREIGRVAGEADWSGAEAKALVDKALAAD
ncbi:redoxin family protein [Phenylobacterium sp.]|uniref:TlpA family protein disulfide reductase n=1 Tax=Phenylobacterium sp. TaxID=1871053 RepID=UPI0028118D25|nr:redoxin family protein [Phenylobacterium sp.]